MNGTVSEMLSRCREAGLSLMVEGDALHVNYKREPPADLIDELRQHKFEIMVALSASEGSPWGNAEEERAAILEHDGAIPRTWAEGFARLHPDRPPRDAPRDRWRQFVDDCGRFLDGGWAIRAAELGWGPRDLFGYDRDRPFPRIDPAGLLWLLSGDRLIELSDRAATIERRGGVRHTYRRKSGAHGRVSAWEIMP